MKYDAMMEKIAENVGSIPIKFKTFRFGTQIDSLAPHWHEKMEILIVDEGEITVEADGDQRTLTPGYAAVFSPHCLHSGKTGTGGAVYRMIMFDAELFVNKTAVIRHYIDMLVNSKISFVHFICDKNLVIKADMPSDEINRRKNPMAVQGYLYILLIYLFENYISESLISLSADNRFDYVTDYILEHYAKKLTTSVLCEKFGYSEAYFCRRFKSETGYTPAEYICITRLEHAKRMLKIGQKVS